VCSLRSLIGRLHFLLASSVSPLLSAVFVVNVNVSCTRNLHEVDQIFDAINLLLNGCRLVFIHVTLFIVSGISYFV